MEFRREPVDKARFSNFVKLHEPRLRSYVSHVYSDRNHLDEALQETFISAWKKFDSISQDLEPAQQFSWLCGTAIRKLSNIYRRERRQEKKFGELWTKSRNTSHLPENEIALGVDTQRVLEELSPEDKMIAMLIFWEDASPETIATLRQSTVASAQKKMQRITQRVRQAMEAENE